MLWSVLLQIDAIFIPLVACKNGYVQLVDNDLDIFLIKDALSRGRVEICISETFQTICEDSWTNDDASVLCSELGFARHG